MRLLFTCLCIGLSQLLLAQSPIKTESWNSNPKLHVLTPEQEKESAVIIYDLRRMEYTDEKDGLAAFKTIHKIIHVNDDKGIESFNKIYLGVSENADIIDIKARTILPGGKIIELDRNNIKDLKDDDGNFYKIFAMDGLVKGSEVEYYYTYKRNASFFNREVIQTNISVNEAIVEVISPKRLVFEQKAYNAPAITVALDTTTDKEKRILTLRSLKLEPAEEEKYSNHTAYLQRVEYKLSYNFARSTKERLFTWNELAQRIYDIYNNHSDKELKKVDELVRKNNWLDLPGEKEKIVAIENYLKKNIASRDDISGDEAANLEFILKNKIASHMGLLRLYSAILTKTGVNYQFVMTGDRSNFAVDRNFENWNNTENYLLYFPNTRKFLAPTRIEMRYPWIYPLWGGTNGLFCKTTTIGNYTTAIGEIRQVPMEEYSATLNNIEAVVKPDPAKDELLIDIRQIYSGYTGAIYRASFNFTNAEQQRSILKEMVKFGTNSENIISSKIENQDFESYSENKPFVLAASVKASELMEKAGDKILLKIGEVIGPQVEMYQEKARQFPMEIEFPHILDRKIELVIPEGYSVKNLDELRINLVYTDNGKQTMGFVSDYSIQGNKVQIRITEDYRLIYYPLSQYEDFKKIINAAADFNKIVLVLEKN